MSREKVILIDAALLLDWNLDKICDYVILITSDTENRIQRLIKNHKLSKKEAISRISSQQKPPEKIDSIIENNSTLIEFKQKLQKVWESILKK